MSDELRVAVLAEEEIRAWQRRALERMLDERDATVSLVVVNGSPDRSPKDALGRALELREWSIVTGLLTLRRRLLGPLPEKASIPVDEAPELDGAERIRCVPEVVDGWKYEIPEQVADRVASEADLGVLFGFGFVTGPILTAPEQGILSFHHGDLREYRGQPMGFWEYVRDEDEAGITLQRINETLDGGEIVYLKRVDIGDVDRWGQAKRRLFRASEDMLSEGVRRIRDDSFTPDRPSELGDLYTHPKGKPVGAYVAKTLTETVLPR